MKKAIFFLLLIIQLAPVAFSQVQRFPKPDFESGYEQPVPTQPAPRAAVWDYIDILVLISAMSLITWFILKKRSRRSVFWVMIFSLLYFGFFKKGCVCSVGSVQNMVLALFDSAYAIPITVVAFFSIPLIFALFFGRTFCAGVCPLGALQDIVGLKPLKTPAWLNQVLGIVPYIYLGLAVLFAATGAGFIICRYDPFVGIFRFGMNSNMFIWGIIVLGTGVFIARPYCRFLCPYSVLLRWMSLLSRHHLTITPTECINCHLCSESCPYDAIAGPSSEKYPGNVTTEKWKLGVMIVAIPIVMIISGWALSQLSVAFSRSHYVVKTAEQIRLEDTGQVNYTTDASEAFRGTGEPTSGLYARASKVQTQFKLGTWLLGAFLALVIMIKIINFYIWKHRDGYTPDKAFCVSCARCVDYCPVEHERLAELKGVNLIE